MVFILEDLIQDDINYLTNVLQEDGNRIKAKMDDLLNNFNQYIQTGDPEFLQNQIRKHSQLKENIDPVIPIKKQQKKRVLADTTENNIPNTIDIVKIKHEKISNVNPACEITSREAGSEESVKSSVNSTININNVEDMPAPKQLPPRKRKIKEEPLDMPKRSTRTRKKPTRYTGKDEVSGKVSDVMIQSIQIPVVDVTDESDKESDNSKKGMESECSDVKGNQQVEPVRSKRTRTIRKVKIESTESQNESVPNKQIDSNISEKNTLNQENLPNATFAIESVNQNATFEVRHEPILMNCTVVLQKSNLNDKDNVTQITPQKLKKKKEVFSPFDKVSTKAKVEAFEKLNSGSSNSPAMSTRGNRKVEEPKKGTPVTTKLPTKVQSTTRVNRIIHRDNSSLSNSSLISSKSQSALKASQAEFRERIKKKQEKEQEALRKREALLLALTEEKRKKREEKELKVQQQREILEKEKIKLMEAQKLKEEKYNKALAEKEEKLQKQKEEYERKHLLAKKKAEEMKQREINKDPSLPIYMITEAPLLPTDDCFDSDQEESERVQHRDVADWSRDRELRKMQYVMLKIGEKIKNTFFSRQVHTPDLQDIFERIDPRKLKRTSSAVWRKPPRYTFFLESSSVQFSEDDE